MNNKLVVGIIGLVVVLAVAGGVFLMNRSSSTPITTTPSPTSQSTNSGTTSGVTQQTFTLTDVANHAVETDCWLAIEGKVYNVTEFVSKHPGGKAILNGCGKDATVLFNTRPTNNRGPHPAQARELLVQYYVGDLQQ